MLTFSNREGILKGLFVWLQGLRQCYTSEMNVRVVCECGNEVEIAEDRAVNECRCPRCGRRVFSNEDDAKAFFDISSSIDGDCPPPITIKNEAPANNAPKSSHSTLKNPPPRNAPFDDPDATVLQSVYTPPPGKENKESVNPNNIQTVTVETNNGDHDSDDFVVAHKPADTGSSILWNVAAEGHTPKYDLSQRVMRPIVKPVLPSIPFSGGGEYGIHRILRIHQRGGMGRILVPYDQYLKRDVAIKELHPDVAEDESIVRRFIGEAEITAQLEHPGVVPIHRLGQGHDGLPYYTMKMIKGETLQDAIKAYHRKPSHQELLGLVRRLVSVAKTMAFAHSKGVIHRDLKPANIMIGEHGETLVMDWGLAKPYNQGIEESYISIVHRTKQPRPELTMVGAIVGTPAFMSPEQALAEENMVGPLSDVFSLGTILYYLLAGQTAFSGRSTQEVLNKVRLAVVTPPSQIKSNVPLDLELICLKAMSKLPEDRYQGATEFADDLCRWLDDVPIAGENISSWGKFKRWVKRNKFLTMGLPCALFLLLAFTGGNFWIAQQYADHSPSVPAAKPIPPEFLSGVQTECSRGTQVWMQKRSTGELSLSCQIDPEEQTNEHILTVHAPPHEPWNLSDREALTFSLLAIPAEGKGTLNKIRIRLGQEESSSEYSMNGEMQDTLTPMQWHHFSIPLKRNLGGWNHVNTGNFNLNIIEKLEFLFETDTPIILNIDNLIFYGE